jgi:hypothetical protein
MLVRARFALARPRGLCALKGTTPAGELTLEPQAYAPVLDALARGPMTFAELARAPEAAQLNPMQLRQALFGMAALRNVQPALPAAGEPARRASVARFNRLQLAAPVSTALDSVLASPVTGAGVFIGVLERLFLESARPEAEALAYARDAVERRKLGLSKEGRLLTGDDEVRAAIGEKARAFFEHALPYYRQLGVLD